MKFPSFLKWHVQIIIKEKNNMHLVLYVAGVGRYDCSYERVSSILHICILILDIFMKNVLLFYSYNPELLRYDYIFSCEWE